MGDFYLIIVLITVFLYFDEKSRHNQRKKAKRRFTASVNRPRNHGEIFQGILSLVHNRRAFLWRLYRRVTYREFTIPRIAFV